jgi:uracil-DNA glycosylase family 4
MSQVSTELTTLSREIIACRRCPRLVEYRRRVAREKKRAFRHDEYWGRPVPGFGDPNARLLIVGLAPATHGANRTGRMFTGDGAIGAGDFLMRALHRAGLANQPTSRSRDDGLRLKDCYLTAIVRCAPPNNKPTTQETANCLGYLARELAVLEDLCAVLALGRLAFQGVLRALQARGIEPPNPRPKFAHGAVYRPSSGPVVIASYHPSRQNTQTGRLTEAMFNEVIALAKREVAPRI